MFSLFENTTPQLYLDIDRTKAQLLGINVPDVFAALQIYLGSAYVNDFNLFGRTYRVVAQAKSDVPRRYRRRAENPRAQQHAARPCRSAPSPRCARSPARIACRATIFIRRPNSTARRRPATARARRSRSWRSLRRETLPQGFSYEWTTLAFQQIRAGNTAIFAFVLAVVFVFLVLAAQFESLTLPLAVILIVPMCLIASIVGVVLRGQDNNILTQVGFIVLIGLAAKNAILIVEFAKQLEDGGRDRFDAAVEAAHLRLAADPDDVVGLHSRRDAAGLGGRRRRRAAADARHRGVLRHDRRHAVRPDLHAGVLCGHALDCGTLVAPPRQQAARATES